jgi:cyclopropane-fatty-acyl-phospholipid synthase
MIMPYLTNKQSTYEKETVCQLLKMAGIDLNGPEPWDLKVNDDRFYHHVFGQGSLGLGESYMAGYWDCKQPDVLLYRVLSANLEERIPHNLRTFIHFIKSKIFNEQSVKKVQKDIRRHYDLGNDLFKAMLDKRMIYSCAYWRDAKGLEEAQDKKLDLICRKLQLKKGQRMLDIGCGWGGLAGFAAEQYGVEVVGITLSQEQASLASQMYRNLPVEIRLQDYRSITEKFDRVVSVGMFEHVGYKNYPKYMSVINNILTDDGLFLLHCIGSNKTVTHTDPWMHSYIFPNGMMPSIKQIGAAAEKYLVMEDWQNIGTHYDRTLMEWLKRFQYAWPNLKDKYNQTFYRMWVYYLCCSAASFRAKKNNLWQIVFSKPTNHAPYQAVR